MNAVKARDFSPIFSRVLYTGFVLLSLYFIFIKKDWGQGLSDAGIALAFDPFDQQVKWNKRPFYQRAWLIAHLLLLLTGFVYALVNNLVL